MLHSQVLNIVFFDFNCLTGVRYHWAVGLCLRNVMLIFR